MKPILLENIPGLTRSLERIARVEESWRELAFLPVHEQICGVPVVQLTLARLNILFAVNSPFIRGGSAPTAEEVAQFLWIVSPQYNTRRLGQNDFTRSIADLDYRRALRAIDRYLDRAMLDRPASSGKGRVIPVTLAAILVHRIASAYGWSRGAILELPLAQLFQFLRMIDLDKDDRKPQLSRLSDRVRAHIIQRFMARHVATEGNAS